MVGSALPHQLVGEHLSALPLNKLLEGGLVVPAGGLFGLLVQDEPLNDLPGLREPAVQIDSGQHSLHGVRPDGGPLPASPGLLPPAQLQVSPQPKLVGHLHQALFAHKGRPGPGQVPFGEVGMLFVEIVRRHHAQNGIAQKLQPLVAAEPPPVLVGVGGVGQGVLQQLAVMKGVA